MRLTIFRLGQQCLTIVVRFRKAGYQAIDRICDYYYSLEEKPVVSQVHPGYLRELLPGENYLANPVTPELMLACLAPSVTVPEEGEDFQTIADDYQKLIVPGGSSSNHRETHCVTAVPPQD